MCAGAGVGVGGVLKVSTMKICPSTKEVNDFPSHRLPRQHLSIHQRKKNLKSSTTPLRSRLPPLGTCTKILVRSTPPPHMSLPLTLT